MDDVVRIPPKKEKSLLPFTTSAGFSITAQPVAIGDVAPTFPAAEIAVWSRSSVLGDGCARQATCRTPSPVRASETWSMFDPPDAVTCFQLAAPAAGTQRASAKAATRDPILTARV